jgi:hypothetical protein
VVQSLIVFGLALTIIGSGQNRSRHGKLGDALWISKRLNNMGFRSEPAIGNYLDALYFTVTTLTTTGFATSRLPGRRVDCSQP